MWQVLHDWVSTAPSGSLSSDAVIEIMIALLGVMIAVLTLIAGLVSAIAAGLAIFGYTEIKKAAAEAAETSAREAATKIANEWRTQVFEMAQAGSLSEVQVDGAASSETPTAEEEAADREAEPVTADKALSDKEESK